MKHGFVYIWRDKKHKRYYVGSHWGTEDDGYVCSSRWMRKSYRRRPDDFKRKIIFRTDDRKSLLKEEGRILAMMKIEEIGVRYYNLNISKVGPGHWSTDESSRLTVGQKIGAANKGRRWTEEQKVKLKGRTPWNKDRPGYTCELNPDDPRRGKPAWNSGKKTGKPSWMTGKCHSEETKKLLSESQRGKTLSAETRAKMSATRKGRKHSPEHAAAISAARSAQEVARRINT